MSASEMFNKGYDYYQSGNYTEAVRWYRKAAEQNQDYAQYNLGVCYEEGLGVQESIDEAVKWYRKAAQQGHEDARTALKRLGKHW